jgi:hypothetical protein
MAYPVSTKLGRAVGHFPDVSKTPFPRGPVPIPYPDTATTPSTTNKIATKTTPASIAPSSYIRPLGDASRLRAALASLHSQLIALPSGDPTRWHTLVDEYVLTAAALYISLSDR